MQCAPRPPPQLVCGVDCARCELTPDAVCDYLCARVAQMSGDVLTVCVPLCLCHSFVAHSLSCVHLAAVIMSQKQLVSAPASFPAEIEYLRNPAALLPPYIPGFGSTLTVL